MKPGATTLLVFDDDAAARAAVPGGTRRSDGLNYRADFVTACCSKVSCFEVNQSRMTGKPLSNR
jgi:hypothetical protein